MDSSDVTTDAELRRQLAAAVGKLGCSPSANEGALTWRERQLWHFFANVAICNTVIVSARDDQCTQKQQQQLDVFDSVGNFSPC